MTDVESLKQMIEQYEEQLSQVQKALTVTPKGPDKNNLLSLQSDMKKLIDLTKESLYSIEQHSSDKATVAQNVDEQSSDALDEEYALFKAEVEAVSSDSNSTEQNETTTDPDGMNVIEDELKTLEGTKCRAPYGSSWGGTGYHNAMVCAIVRTEDSVSTLNDIKVRVLFLNPTHKEMLPCPYFLDGACKFSEDKCHYSHGEIVPLSTLQEYREPDFSKIKMGSRVLAKQKNNLWHRCVVLKIPNKDDDEYRIKFESSGKIEEVNLQQLLPLDDADLEMSDSSDETDEFEVESIQDKVDELIHKSLLTLNSNEALGSWEQYTRGIGSKLMAQMGYIHGTGLGKRSDGRVEPVEATVLPAGKSLDHCMELRENAGGDKNLFSVERKMRKQQQKMEQLREKQYLKEKQQERSNVFNFINSTLGDTVEKEDKPRSSKQTTNLKTESNQNLNLASFQVGENILKLEKESTKLMSSLTRHSKDSAAYQNIKIQYEKNQIDLASLRTSERNIAIEQKQRKNRAKLSIF